MIYEKTKFYPEIKELKEKQMTYSKCRLIFILESVEFFHTIYADILKIHVNKK